MTWLAVSGDAGRGCGFRGVNFGLPPGDGALFGAGVQGYLGAVVGDAEVGVLDVDGDDLPGVTGSGPQPLAGDYDDAISGTLRWTLTGPGAGGGSGVAAIRAPRSWL